MRKGELIFSSQGSCCAAVRLDCSLWEVGRPVEILQHANREITYIITGQREPTHQPVHECSQEVSADEKKKYKRGFHVEMPEDGIWCFLYHIVLCTYPDLEKLDGVEEARETFIQRTSEASTVLVLGGQHGVPGSVMPIPLGIGPVAPT